jgi:anti-sigma B factor antagonist
MNLEIEQREKEGIPILDLKGHLVQGDEDQLLRQKLTSLLDTGHSKVLLNLKHVTAMDSTGLGTLNSFAAKLHAAGGLLALLNFSESHMKTALVLELDTEFKIFRDEQEAVNSFFPDRAGHPYDILEFVEEQEQDHGTVPPKKE